MTGPVDILYEHAMPAWAIALAALTALAAFVLTVWRFLRWDRTSSLIFAPRLLAYGVLAGCLLLHALGLRTQQTRLSLFAFIGLLWSIPAYLAGPRVGRLLAFPCAYLAFCVPFTFFDVLSFRLRVAGRGSLR